ncbi:hypothetical protein BDF14DRAFT_1804476 [Spinellus fusiger]|nr:hypothetical protein BDF14DRAFT_1804476 [Spinellus fusiger]
MSTLKFTITAKGKECSTNISSETSWVKFLSIMSEIFPYKTPSILYYIVDGKCFILYNVDGLNYILSICDKEIHLWDDPNKAYTDLEASLQTPHDTTKTGEEIAAHYEHLRVLLNKHECAIQNHRSASYALGRLMVLAINHPYSIDMNSLEHWLNQVTDNASQQKAEQNQDDSFGSDPNEKKGRRHGHKHEKRSRGHHHYFPSCRGGSNIIEVVHLSKDMTLSEQSEEELSSSEPKETTAPKETTDPIENDKCSSDCESSKHYRGHGHYGHHGYYGHHGHYGKFRGYEHHGHLRGFKGQRDHKGHRHYHSLCSSKLSGSDCINNKNNSFTESMSEIERERIQGNSLNNDKMTSRDDISSNTDNSSSFYRCHGLRHSEHKKHFSYEKGTESHQHGNRAHRGPQGYRNRYHRLVISL